jgi:dipeptidyl aminopeptidase/acylaminoacyl peptidase
MVPILRSLVPLLGFLTALPSAGSQQVSPIPPESILSAREFPALSEVQISPNSEWVAYALLDNSRRQSALSSPDGAPLPRSVSGVPGFVVGSDVWLANVKTRKQRNLTGGKGSSWGPVWSPDGQRLGFYSDRSGKVRVWIWDSSTDSARQLSDLNVSVNNSFETMQWTPDGLSLLTVAANETIGKGEPRVSAEENEPAHGHPEAAPSIFLYTAKKGLPPFSSHDAISPSILDRDLVAIDLKSTRVSRFAQGFQPLWYRISPSGKQLAFTSHAENSTDDHLNTFVDLVVVDLSGRRTRVIARRFATSFGMNFSWSPDSRSIAYVASQVDKSGKVKGECFVVALSGGEPRNLTPAGANFATVFGVPLWDRESKNIYLLSLRAPLKEYLYDSLWQMPTNGRDTREITELSRPSFAAVVAPSATCCYWTPNNDLSMIVMTRNPDSLTDGFSSVDLRSGTVTKIVEEQKSYGLIGTQTWSIAVSHDAQYALFRAQDVKHSEDVWMLRALDLHQPERVTDINPQLDNFAMGTGRLIEWAGLDGQSLSGGLLLPVGYTQGTRYPLIVFQYPGLFRSMLLNEFGMADDAIDNMQVFASRGYAILIPDVPINAGTPMRDILNAVMPGVDKVVDLGIADPSHLGVMGHSWGGYGVLSIISQTNRFKAAVSRSGVGGDLVRFYTTMQSDGTAAGMTETEVLETGGTLWDKRDVFIENSPIFYLDRVQTPLLLTHGTSDPVSSALSDEVFVCLRRLDKPVEYAKYQGEAHYEWEWSYDHQIDVLNRIIHWFDNKLKEAPTRQ